MVILMMVVHIIRPLGLPGLRRRKDFWKIAVFAIILIMLTVAVSHAGRGSAGGILAATLN